MTIMERIQLHKLGYTKDEINELAKENYNVNGLVEKPVENVEIPPEEPEKKEPAEELKPDNSNTEILDALKQLTATIQQSNITASRQPEQPKETAEDILYTLL